MFNKKKNILLYVLIFIMVFSIDVKRVRGNGISINPSNPGIHTSCTGGNCLNMATTGIRVAVVDDVGKVKGKIVDYWLYDDEKVDNVDCNAYESRNGFLLCRLNSKPYYFKTKRLKQDLKKVYLSNKQILKDDFVYGKYTLNPIVSGNYGMKGILSGLNRNYNNGFVDSSGNNPKNVRAFNVASTIGKRIYGNIDNTIDEYMNESENINLNSENKKYVKQIFDDTDSHLSVDHLVGKYYIQIEPLIAVENGGMAFYGTINEFVIFQLISNRDCNTIGYGNYLGGNNAFFNANCYSYINMAGHLGTYSDTFFPSIFSSSDGSYGSYPRDAYEQLKKYFVDEESNRADGVGFVSLEKISGGGCPQIAIEYIENDGPSIDTFKKNIKKIIQEKIEWNPEWNWLETPEKYGFSDIQKIENYLNRSTSGDACKADCNYIVKNNFGRTKDLTDEVIKLFAKLNSAKSYYNYEYWTGKIIHSNTSQGINRNNPPNARLDNVDTNNLCGFKTCKQMLTLSNYKILAKFFPRTSGLQDEIVELIGSPDCEYELPDCHVDNVKVSCDNASHIITFKDSKSNDSRCLPGGIAYTTEKSLVSSKEPEYGKNAYCYEEVTFDFPTTPQKTKAGTLLKWGNGLNNGNNVFGSMALSRTCYNMNTSNKVTFNWLKNINPDIRMYYVEGLSNDNVSSAYEPKKIISNNEMGIAINKMYLSYDNGFDYKWICDSRESCSKINSNNTSYTFDKKNSMVRFEFSWDIIYSNKFRWYENKDKNVNETLNEEEYNSGSSSGFNRNNYSPLGYGLPTTFVEPTGKYSHFTYDVDSKTKDGQMFVTVTNVGTMHNNKYHFNDYIKYKLSDSKDSKPGNKDKIYYSCDYNIYNELFGYEDGEECVDCSTPKGIDVVFRTVELINENADIEEQIDRAFPGKAGRGRERGSNWTVNKSTGDNYTNDDIASILSSDVYNNEPMYSISLDSALIQEIRNSNREIRNTTAPDGTNLDPYTYMGTDEEYGYTKGLREVPDEDTDESSLKYFYISNWLTNLSRHNDRFTINNDLENMKDEYIRNYAQYNRDRVSSLLPSIFR